MKRAAIFPSRGIGDALLMMIAAHRLREFGYDVVCFHSSLLELDKWFVGYTFEKLSNLKDLEGFSYDLAIVQNDNSSKIEQLLELEKKGVIKKLSIFYAGYNSHKHFSLRFYDQVFDRRKTMADNIAKGVSKLLGTTTISKNNGLIIPRDLIHRCNRKRVLIHASSSNVEKNWPLNCYVAIAKKLTEDGFEPVFISHHSDPAMDVAYKRFVCRNLDEMASYIYESGYVIGNDSLVGHLASNLVIPNLVIADCKKRMNLWRPGWLMGKVVTPPFWVPNLKFFRCKEKYWKECVTPKRVLRYFRLIRE